MSVEPRIDVLVSYECSCSYVATDDMFSFHCKHQTSETSELTAMSLSAAQRRDVKPVMRINKWDTDSAAMISGSAIFSTAMATRKRV